MRVVLTTLIVLIHSLDTFGFSGFYNTFEDFLQIDKQRLLKKKEIAMKKSFSINDVNDLKQVELDSDFITSILFNTPSRYLLLGTKDKCSLYDLIKAGLVKSSEEELNIYLIQYKNKNGTLITAGINSKEFFDKIVSIQCPQTETFAKYFNLENIQKTFSQYSLEIPVDFNSCNKMRNDFIADYKAPYFCQTAELASNIPDIQKQINLSSNRKEIDRQRKRLQVAIELNKKLNPSAIEHINHICTHLDNPEKLCHSFFNNTFWSKVIKKERPSIYMEGLCQHILGKEISNEKQLEACQKQMEKNVELCHYGLINFPSLKPAPNCDEISKALNFSRLYDLYQDCPAQIKNEAVTLSSRVLYHITPSKIEKSDYCSSPVIHEFIAFNEKVFNENAWQVQLCYDDKIKNEEVCYPTLLGNYPLSPYSLDKNIIKILARTKAAPENLQCEIVENNEYNSVLLKFKTGCFILQDKEKCNIYSCPRKIIYEDKEITHIRFKNSVIFEFFATSMKEEKNSQHVLIQNSLNKKFKKVENTTQLKEHFQQSKKTIIYGMGCVEDLLPSSFKKTAFNQCRPTTFIIDGIIDNKNLGLVARISIDNIHTPRILSWSTIFSAVRNYQLIHPMSMWSLYAVE